MTQYANTILVVDEASHTKRYDEHLGEIFAGWGVVCVPFVLDVMEYLGDASPMPRIMFFDAFAWNGTEGYEDFKELSDWLKENRSGELPEHVVFTSADDRYARNCKDMACKANILPAENIFAVTTPEIYETNHLLDKYYNDRLCGGSGWDFNTLVNRVLGTDFPISRDELDAYRIKHAIMEEKDAVDFYEYGKVTAAQALDILKQKNSYPFSSGSWVHVSEYESNRNHQGLRFEKGSGKDCHGHVAFTIDQAKEIRLQGKSPILVVNSFEPELYPQLCSLSGVVSLKETNPGHLFLFAEAYDVTALIGDTEGAAIEADEQDCQVLRLRDKEFRYNDPITISAQRHWGYLYPGHLELEKYYSYEYVSDIPGIYSAALKEIGCTPMAFKGNVDSPNQVREAAKLTNGVGLVRSEHFAFADAAQLNGLRKIFSGADSDGKAINAFFYGQYAQYKKLFNNLSDNLDPKKVSGEYSVCIRLLDAPPDEFLNADELKALNERVPAQNQRGVQMGLNNPDLYRKQLKAVFRAYAHHLNARKQTVGKPDIKLEVMVPTVRSFAELAAVKTMTEDAAKSCGISRDEFRFGMMLETLDAARNVGVMAPHVDFISFGSNDLTAEVLGISRSDAKARRKYYDEETKKGDPFVNLHGDVAETIIRTAQLAREANNYLEIGLCGAHAADLDSLKAVRPAGLNYISLPPSERNHVALKADWAIYDFGERQNSGELRRLFYATGWVVSTIQCPCLC